MMLVPLYIIPEFVAGLPCASLTSDGNSMPEQIALSKHPLRNPWWVTIRQTLGAFIY